jgi:hypothetical protein
MSLSNYWTRKRGESLKKQKLITPINILAIGLSLRQLNHLVEAVRRNMGGSGFDCRQGPSNIFK